MIFLRHEDLKKNLLYNTNFLVLPSGNKSTGNISTDSTPNWLKSAQTQLDAANKAILELTGMQPNQQAKVRILRNLNFTNRKKVLIF